MSSILDALKKLEKEKIHRDEISTAIASDILRSGKKPVAPQWRFALALFIFILIVAGLFLYFSRDTMDTPIPFSNLQPVANPEQVNRRVEPVQPILSDVQAVSTLPELPVLSGIVYQQQAEARMAILNDLPVMEGMEVADFTLQKIFPDHVLLRLNGKTYTLFINP
jgi:general secretion pathway protein B